LEWEADPRHAEIVVETLGLMRAINSKELSSPGVERTLEEVEQADALDPEHSALYRSLCMRINYLAQDRPDLQFTAKEMARWMAKPNLLSWEIAKRCGRDVLGRPCVAQRFGMQGPVDKITVWVDSDHAGCIRTRRSTTGLAAFHGRHLIKAASTTQTVIALSIGESEFYANVRGVATALGMKSMAKDFGLEMKLQLETDSVAGRGMALRLGAGKVRHIDAQWLWVQGIFNRREAVIKKIPGVTNDADLLTKFLDGVKIKLVMEAMGFEFASGRSNLALRAA
jgi:hypothetical protein